MRITIKISDELGQKLDQWAGSYGMTKSGFVAYALGNHIHDLEYKNDIVSTLANKINDMPISQKQEEEPKEFYDEQDYYE